MTKFSGLRLVGAIVLLTVSVPSIAQTPTSITGSRHDMSVSGSGPVKATSEKQVCLFCHVAHGAKPAVPLWNHQVNEQSYATYPSKPSSTYIQNAVPTVSQRSKLCLSCHDGSIAEMGQTVRSGLISTTGTMSSNAFIGRGSAGLSNDHPFGFQMPARDDGEIKLTLTAPQPTTSDPAVKLYSNAIECVTCHEPHEPARDTAFQFMVRDNKRSAICVACHDTSRGALVGWTSGVHATALNKPGIGSGLPYTNPNTVATNACSSCHIGHNAPGSGIRLLRGAEDAYSTCANCHGTAINLEPAPKDVISDFQKKTYSHPSLRSTGLHDPRETLPVVTGRHSACQDCHDPHASQTSASNLIPPSVEASLAGASGVSAADGVTVLSAAVNEYEICFKCHGNSNNKPQAAAYTDYGYTPYRLTFDLSSDPYNVRASFQTSGSRHNVTQPSKGNIAPSLRTNILTLSGGAGRGLKGAGLFLYCTDCHNSDTSARAGSASNGANGPHGSDKFHLLERRYEYDLPPVTRGDRTTGPVYSTGFNGPYALCDKCHDLNTLVTNDKSQDTVFHEHFAHVSKGQVACASCHASHGVERGSTLTNPSLVDFDKRIVGPDNKGNLSMNTTAKTCTLTCHGVQHNGRSYAP